MSKKSRRTSNAISVYLSPRAKQVLDQYHENSGFGSLSRTVEELILTYDKIHKTLLSAIATSGLQKFFSNPVTIVVTFLMMINSLNLNDGSPFEQTLRMEIQKMMRERSGKWSHE